MFLTKKCGVVRQFPVCVLPPEPPKVITLRVPHRPKVVVRKNNEIVRTVYAR